jgi:shikimate kinase
MTKTLYMLIGPKGSGKTYIGTVVATHTDIHFISVEPVWLTLQPGEDGWQKVEQVIEDAFTMRDKVMIESLGSGEGFQQFHQRLVQKYPVVMIRIHADANTCLTRVQHRDSANHIPIPLEKVADYNRIAANVRYDWALELNNEIPLSEAEIIDAIRMLT